MSDTADDIDQLADRVIDQLEPGFYDGKLVLSRRQAIALTGSTFSAAALIGVGFGQAAAQEAAGQVGTDDDRVDVFAAGGGTVALADDITSAAITGGYEITIDGDVYEFVEEE